MGEVGILALLILGVSGAAAVVTGGSESDDDESNPVETDVSAEPETETALPDLAAEPLNEPESTTNLEVITDEAEAGNEASIVDETIDYPWVSGFQFGRAGSAFYDEKLVAAATNPVYVNFPDDPNAVQPNPSGNDANNGVEFDSIHSITGTIGFNSSLIGEVIVLEEGSQDLDFAPGLIVEDGTGQDVIYGRDGHDWIKGMLGNDRIYGGSGDDWLNGGREDDVIYGGSGNDSGQGAGGNDSIYLGVGSDINIYAPTFAELFQSVTVDEFLEKMAADREGELAYFLTENQETGEPTVGQDRNDLFRLAGDNYGDDFIRGGGMALDEAGNRIFDFDEDGNRLWDGADTIIDGYGSNTIYGDLGNDMIMAFDSQLAVDPDESVSDLQRDTIFGGFDSDIIFADNGDTVTLDPEGGNADKEYSDTLVIGTAFSEIDVSKVVNQEAVTVTDFVPEDDRLVIMNYTNADGQSDYSGAISYQQVGADTEITIGGTPVALLQNTDAATIEASGSVIIDTDKSVVDQILSANATDARIQVETGNEF